MKICPVCRTVYTDESLRYCLTDGAALTIADDEQPTVVAAPRRPVGNARPLPKQSGAGRWIKIILVLVILGAAAIAVVGGLGALFYYISGRNGSAPTKGTERQLPTPTVTADAEKEKLEQELANLQKQLEEKPAAPTANKDPFPDDDERGSSITATVNSPNDGFLAMRTVPDAENGVRIAKIPHGSEVEIENCEKRQTIISGRSGRWCQVTYHNETGWVFDAWLEY